jgi:hypothetical protein
MVEKEQVRDMELIGESSGPAFCVYRNPASRMVDFCMKKVEEISVLCLSVLESKLTIQPLNLGLL